MVSTLPAGKQCERRYLIAGSFRYLPIAVQLVEPGVRIRLQNAAEAHKMALRVDAFSVRAVGDHIASTSPDPALRSSRTYVHKRPVFVFLLPGNNTGTGESSAWSLPSVSA